MLYDKSLRPVGRVKLENQQERTALYTQERKEKADDPIAPGIKPAEHGSGYENIQFQQQCK